MNIPPHLIDRGIQAIIRRREAESGVRLVLDENDPQPVGSPASANIDRRDHGEGERG